MDIHMEAECFLLMQSYKWSHRQDNGHHIFRVIWKSSVMLRYKIFFWLLLHDRVSTRNLLQRKHFFLQSYLCELCNLHTEETALHLFWDCCFAFDCWDSICNNRRRWISALDEIMLLLDSLPRDFGMDIIIGGYWHIWLQRKSKIFKAQNHSLQTWKYQLMNDLERIRSRIEIQHQQSFTEWIDTHLV